VVVGGPGDESGGTSSLGEHCRGAKY
jgi:hypothetical protein